MHSIVESVQPLIYPIEKGEHLNKWVYDVAGPYIKGRILEANSTTKSFSAILIDKGIGMHLNQSAANIYEELKAQFTNNSAVRFIHNMDLRMADHNGIYKYIYEAFDTIVLLGDRKRDQVNRGYIQGVTPLLGASGHLVFLLPVYTTLYTESEWQLEDLKRYNYGAIREIVKDDFEILKTRYCNLEAELMDDEFIVRGLSVLVIARKKPTNESSSE